MGPHQVVLCMHCGPPRGEPVNGVANANGETTFQDLRLCALRAALKTNTPKKTVNMSQISTDFDDSTHCSPSKRIKDHGDSSRRFHLPIMRLICKFLSPPSSHFNRFATGISIFIFTFILYYLYFLAFSQLATTSSTELHEQTVCWFLIYFTFSLKNFHFCSVWEKFFYNFLKLTLLTASE